MSSYKSLAAGNNVDDDAISIQRKDDDLETKWVMDVKDEMDTSKEVEHWRKRSIYKIPACVTDLNRKAYKPQFVSFGPYHHGEDHLRQMEDHKQRALHLFLKRSTNNKPIDTFMDALEKVVQQLMDSYDWLDSKWLQPNSTARFLQLMMLDGCFMLEVLRTATRTTDDYAFNATRTTDDYAFNDPIFSHHGKLYIMPYIRRDMLMLQNQLPMLLLDTLLAIEKGKTTKQNEEFLNRIITKFCAPANTPIQSLGPCLHVLDVHRKSLLQDLHRKSRPTTSTSTTTDTEISSGDIVPCAMEPHSSSGDIVRSAMEPHSSSGDIVRSDMEPHSSGDIVRSAMELHEAGIRFKISKTMSLKDISFRGGVLRLPTIVVDDTTESTFLNLMAFERFHVGAGNEITAYMFFMDNIIDSAKDVSLLHTRGIIQNALGSDKAVAKLFNELSKDVTLDPDSSLNKVHKKVHDYCRKSWNLWRANLIHTYFRNPWAILSLVAAALLMAVTIAQTVYTIYDYYRPKSGGSPRSLSSGTPTPSPR